MGFPWGLDFGNQNCALAVARKGGIDVIDNEASSRRTPWVFCVCVYELSVVSLKHKPTSIKQFIYTYLNTALIHLPQQVYGRTWW